MGIWENKVVVVAGGSSGLGLAIAKAFHRQGAFVVLLARSQGPLEAEVNSLLSERAESAAGFQVDLLNADQVQKTVDKVVQLQNRIDVWVNAVGQSTRVEFSQAGPELYRELMEQNFFSAVNGVYAALNVIEQTNGHVVNIGSLASKTAWPYVAPYVTSKHALAGFTDQMRLEGPANVHYLLVCPGPIASNSNDVRYQVTAGMSDEASRPGAGAPVKLIDPNWLGDKIVDACRRRKPELVVPARTRVLFGLLQLWPRAGQALLKRITRNK